MPIWEGWHGERDNSGLARVNTAPIRAPLTIPNLGSFADGAGPVTAFNANGQVFIGNEQGRLFAFEANGTKLWHRDLGGGFVIRTSPVVGTSVQAQFTVYVLGTRTVTDHTVSPAVKRAFAKLFAFSETGALRWGVALPFEDVREFRPAPPNILQRLAGPDWTDTVILTLAFVSNPFPGLHTRLIAVSQDGLILAAKDVSSLIEPITNDWWPIGHGFDVDTTDNPAWETPVVLPAPGAAIERFGIAPRIWVTDGHKKLAVYNFDGAAFTEVERFDLPMSTSPVMLDQAASTSDPLRRALYATVVDFRHSTLNGDTKIITDKHEMGLCPTCLGNHVTLFTTASLKSNIASRLVVVANDAIVSNIALPSQTVVPAVASLSHVFVSTKDFFLQFDRSMQKVGEVPWVKGGRVGPAIGPGGWVYAMASNILFIFPPLQGSGPLGGAHTTTHTPIGGLVHGILSWFVDRIRRLLARLGITIGR